MPVVLRPRPITVVLGLAVLVAVFIVGSRRNRVEIRADRVRFVRTVGSDDVPRQAIVAVDAGEDRRRPPFVALEDRPIDRTARRRGVTAPGLIATRRIAIGFAVAIALDEL